MDGNIDKKIRPCLKCGNKDIKIWDCGYSSFNTGGAVCKCGNKVELKICGCSPRNEIIESWNASNPPISGAIKIIEKNIEELQRQIKEKRIEIRELKKRRKI